MKFHLGRSPENLWYQEHLVKNTGLKEAEIIKKCKKGDHQAFNFLVKNYAPRLMGICLRYMGDRAAAEDVLQESFIRVFKSISKYKKTGSFEAWLSRITVTTALMELRKNKKRSFEAELDPGINGKHGQEAFVEIKMNEADILEMMDELPESYRIIFNLFVIEGYNHQEISTLLEIKESTSRTKLTRARRKMQEIYINKNKQGEILEQKKRTGYSKIS